jgi:hypothetical protein
VPTAAAIAIATVHSNAAANQVKPAEGPPLHRDRSGPVIDGQPAAANPRATA